MVPNRLDAIKESTLNEHAKAHLAFANISLALLATGAAGLSCVWVWVWSGCRGMHQQVRENNAIQRGGHGEIREQQHRARDLPWRIPR